MEKEKVTVNEIGLAVAANETLKAFHCCCFVPSSLSELFILFPLA